MPSSLSGGYDTHWIETGQGEETALLLHCSLARAQAWSGVMAGLQNRLSMRALDLPGHGQSADWDPSRDYQEQARDMALGCFAGPSHLIGHSYGATVALRIAVDYPELVKTLTLIEPVFFAAALRKKPEIYAQFVTKQSLFISAIAEGDLDKATRLFLDEWGDGSPWADLSERDKAYMRDRIHLVPAAAPAIIDDNAGLFDQLGDVGMPVLLMEGRMSPPIVGAIQSVLEQELTNVTRVGVPGANHMLPVTKPLEVNVFLETFLARES